MVISSLSVLGVSTVIWIFALFHPGVIYAERTEVDQVSIYHNQPLSPHAEQVVKNALEIITPSELFSEKINIQLCLNDASVYPALHPLGAGIAYAFSIKRFSITVPLILRITPLRS